MNQICLYSNGLGVFERTYALTENQPLKIAIPVPTDTLDEAISSIGVFGDVTLNEPPSFAPTNSQPRGITLEASDVIRDMARKMRGATLTIETVNRSLRGTVAGLQESVEVDGISRRTRFRIVLFEEDGTMRSVADNEIVALKFAESSVQAEIDKALRRAFEQVKPDSSYINLTVTPNSADAQEVIVQYALANMGAWKIGYRLRSNNGIWGLEGQAVVDNSTDEAWNDVLISVASGQPISFATDIAEIRLVRRGKENIVSEEALGAYEMAEESTRFALSASAPSLAMGATFDALESASQAKSYARRMSAPRAIQESADVKATGEIVQYTARRPVTIAANQSAVIPMFEAKLDYAKKLLVYRSAQHATRPYRAVEFVNAAGHGIGKGVVTLFEDGDYIGKAILKEMAAGDKQILPYALEPRVRIDDTRDSNMGHTARIQISGGVAVTETVNTREKTYVIHNPYSEPFTLEIEHLLVYHATWKANLSTGETPEITPIEGGGKRLRFTLPAEQTIQLTCLETHLYSQSVELGEDLEADWFTWNLFEQDQSLASNPTIQECVALQKERDAIDEQIETSEYKVEMTLEQQKRLMDLIKVGGLEADMTEWRGDLAANEREIRQHKTQQARLKEQVTALKVRLREALNRLAVTWNAA